MPVIMLVLAAGPAAGATVVLDDFDDGALDPAWALEFVNTNAWTYQEVGSEIIVSDIVDFVVNEDWVEVKLVRPVAPLGDFTADFAFAWDSEGSGDAMQNVFLRLLDNMGSVVVAAGAWDAWRLSPGSRYGQIGTSYTPSSLGSIPLSGSATVQITRNGPAVEISWDGAPLLADTTSAGITTVEITFAYFHQSGSTTSFFGNEAVDFLHIQGAAPSDVPPGPSPLGAVALHGNCPNPFNPGTTIAFSVRQREDVSLRVFDMSGRLVSVLIAGESRSPGRHEAVWNGRDDFGRQMASGTYICRLEAGGATKTQRMVLVK